MIFIQSQSNTRYQIEHQASLNTFNRILEVFAIYWGQIH